MKDYKAGVTAPPFHCYCRTTTIPYIKGVTDSKEDSRAYRDEDDKTVYTDETLTYDEWYNKYVKGEELPKVPKKQEPLSVASIKRKMDGISLVDCSHHDIIDLGKMVAELHDIPSIIGNKEALKEVFSNYRNMGVEVPKDMWGKYSNVENKKMLQDAFSVYPSDWLDYVKLDQWKIFTPKKDRGFFAPVATDNGKTYFTRAGGDPKRDYITIAMSGWKKTTPFHEIGHMVEHYNTSALRVSKSWIAERTQGDSLEYLSEIFKEPRYKMEMTKADNFISPYIGKDYGDSASECLSMGLESIFEPGEGQIQKNCR